MVEEVQDRAVMEEEEPLSNASSPRARSENDNIVEEIVAIIKSVRAIGEFRKTQSKECLNVVRRLKVFLPLLEEINGVEKTTIPIAALICLKKLKRAFNSAKKLLKLCHAGSKIYLALESEAMKMKFHAVYEKIGQAVEGMPYEELRISEQEKEQIESLREQLTRAKKRTDTQDMELTMDMMVALSTNNDRNADCASIERLANKLSLRTVEELKQETLDIRKLVKEKRSLNRELTQQIIDLLNKFKRLAGVAEHGIRADPKLPRSQAECTSIAIPNEFLCPITLEMMMDPVIIATGQTYERESIQEWLDSGNQTCPKTGQTLTHLCLAPNYALKNIIRQWIDQNNFPLPKKELVLESPKSPSSTNNEDIIKSLVKKLSSSKLDEQREAVWKIRMISKESPESRTLIANCGGIPLLVPPLSYPDSRIQEDAVTALLNLSIDESNKKLISKEEAIPPIIEILQKGTVGAKENSAAALFSLSMLNENKVKIGSLNGITPLVDLLTTGTIRGKKDAITALFNLCLNHANKSRAIEAGIVTPLLKVLDDEKLEMVNETLSLLLLLSCSVEGRHELGQLSFMERIVGFVRDGTPKNKECAIAILLELGSCNSNLILAALQYGVYEHLVEVSRNGTERGRRKAEAMLRLMSRAEQIP